MGLSEYYNNMVSRKDTFEKVATAEAVYQVTGGQPELVKTASFFQRMGEKFADLTILKLAEELAEEIEDANEEDKKEIAPVAEAVGAMAEEAAKDLGPTEESAAAEALEEVAPEIADEVATKKEEILAEMAQDPAYAQELAEKHLTE